MKNLLLSIFVALVISSSAFAQSEHLAFKGIPIDGTLEEYVANLKSVQFRVSELKKDEARLIGNFAGYKDCTVTVSSIMPRNLVNEITVCFPYVYQWSTLIDNYNELKQMLTQKYDKPLQQTFDLSYYDLLGDSSKFRALSDGEIIIRCSFVTSKGTIQMWIEGFRRSAAIKIKYTDKVNTETVKADAYNDL